SNLCPAARCHRQIRRIGPGDTRAGKKRLTSRSAGLFDLYLLLAGVPARDRSALTLSLPLSGVHRADANVRALRPARGRARLTPEVSPRPRLPTAVEPYDVHPHQRQARLRLGLTHHG